MQPEEKFAILCILRNFTLSEYKQMRLNMRMSPTERPYFSWLDVKGNMLLVCLRSLSCSTLN